MNTVLKMKKITIPLGNCIKSGMKVRVAADKTYLRLTGLTAEFGTEFVDRVVDARRLRRTIKEDKRGRIPYGSDRANDGHHNVLESVEKSRNLSI